MTLRIYYTEPACREFDAVVIASAMQDGQPVAVLDRTAFYPTSGGQPFDTGRLGTARVVNVIDDDARVLHVLDVPLAVGSAVHGSIDWDRRFDHMQQHTGQHVLSAAFEHLGGNRTASFHLGSEFASIDLEREASWPEIDAAIETANRTVWEDRPVSIRFVSAAEASALPLRKAPPREGRLRLIDVAGVDLSACGGTHVSRTGAIGMIAAVAAEKFKGGTRVTFTCGGRALRALGTYRRAIAGSVRALSVLPDELPAAIEKLQQEAKDLRKTTSGLLTQLAVHEADRLFASTPNLGGLRTIVQSVNGLDAQALKAMAAALAARGGTLAALVSAARPVLVVIARSPGVAIDASALLRQLIAENGGKGGGKADLAQGGGMDAEPDAIVAALRRLISG